MAEAELVVLATDEGVPMRDVDELPTFVELVVEELALVELVDKELAPVELGVEEDEVVVLIVTPGPRIFVASELMESKPSWETPEHVILVFAALAKD